MDILSHVTFWSFSNFQFVEGGNTYCNFKPFRDTSWVSLRLLGTGIYFTFKTGWSDATLNGLRWCEGLALTGEFRPDTFPTHVSNFVDSLAGIIFEISYHGYRLWNNTYLDGGFFWVNQSFKAFLFELWADERTLLLGWTLDTEYLDKSETRFIVYSTSGVIKLIELSIPIQLDGLDSWPGVLVEVEWNELPSLFLWLW